jgi:hypothetical protein
MAGLLVGIHICFVRWYLRGRFSPGLILLIARNLICLGTFQFLILVWLLEHLARLVSRKLNALRTTGLSIILGD